MPDLPPLRTMTIEAAFEAVAARRPAPGGGAVSAIAAGLAAALGRMAAAFSDRSDLPEAVADAASRLQRAQAALLELADDDAAAYARLTALEKLDEGDPQREELPAAAALATSVPLAIAATASSALAAAEVLVPACNRWLRSDLAISAILAEAAARSAARMVDANLSTLRRHAGGAAAKEAAAERDAVLESAAEHLSRVLEACDP
jgi:formiminotetrahydrofolate cyclodeaminase